MERYLHRSLHPAWMDQAPNALALVTALEMAMDLHFAGVLRAIQSKFPHLCDAAILPILAESRRVFTGPQESVKSLRRRTQRAWSNRAYIGTGLGVARDLAALGCNKIMIVRQTGSRTLYDSTSGRMRIVSSSWTAPWSRVAYLQQHGDPSESAKLRDYWLAIWAPSSWMGGAIWGKNVLPGFPGEGQPELWGGADGLLWGGLRVNSTIKSLLLTCARHQPAHARLREIILLKDPNTYPDDQHGQAVALGSDGQVYDSGVLKPDLSSAVDDPISNWEDL